MACLFHQIHLIGFLRDPNDKEHLIIDRKAEMVIKRIFNEYLEDVNCHEIARRLNNDFIPTRLEHMKTVGINIGKSKKPKIIKYKIEIGDTLQSISEKYKVFPIEIIQLNNIIEHIDNSEKARIIEEQKLIEGHILDIPKKTLWDDGMVREILRNEMYTGYLALGKTVNKSYKDRTKVKLPRDEWIRVPNCHESIIDRDIWLKAKEKLLKNTYNARKEAKNLFAKKLYCACCGRGMQKGRNLKNNENDYYISCKTVNKIGRFCDNRKTIKKSELEDILLKQINKMLDKYYNRETVKENYNELQYKDINKKIENLKLKFNNIEYSLSGKTNKLSQLYEDRISGILTTDEFKILKGNIDREITKLNNEKEEINIEICEYEKKIKKDDKEKNELFEKYERLDKITPEILNEFVNKIYLGRFNEVTNSRDIKIIWNIDKKEEIV